MEKESGGRRGLHACGVLAARAAMTVARRPAARPRRSPPSASATGRSGGGGEAVRFPVLRSRASRGGRWLVGRGLGAHGCGSFERNQHARRRLRVARRGAPSVSPPRRAGGLWSPAPRRGLGGVWRGRGARRGECVGDWRACGVGLACPRFGRASPRACRPAGLGQRAASGESSRPHRLGMGFSHFEAHSCREAAFYKWERRQPRFG